MYVEPSFKTIWIRHWLINACFVTCREIVNKMFEDKWKRLRHKRDTRDPMFTRSQLLRGWLNANGNQIPNNRMMKSSADNEINDKPK